MCDLNVRTIPLDSIKNLIKCDKFSGMYLGKIGEKNFLLLKHNITSLIVFKDSNLSDIEFSKVVSSVGDIPGEVKIVGNKYSILLLDGEGSLWKFICNGSHSVHKLTEVSNYKWVPYPSSIRDYEYFQKFNILDITEDGRGFACFGLKGKHFKVYKFTLSENIEPSTVKDVREINSTLKYFKNEQIFWRHEDGIFFLNSINRNSHEGGLSGEMVSIIHVESQNCWLVCYKSGKISARFSTSQDRSVYLGKKITSIVKCFCSDSCLLWSDGVGLHHTELNFSEDKIKLTHFEVKCNITGILAFAKFSNSIIAFSINNIYYHISQDLSSERKQLIRGCSVILSQIYNESLKLNDNQKKLETTLEFLNCKEVIQTNHDKIELKLEGSFITIKNKARITFKKKYWKINFKMPIEGSECVKVVDLEGDLTSEMMLKVAKPFDYNGRVKVYLVGDFAREILYFYVGMVEEDVDLKRENLKNKLLELNRHKNPYFLKN